MKPKADRTGWIIFTVVLGAFILLIGAWVCFFWIASQNRVADVSLETVKAVEVVERTAGLEDPAATQAADSAANTQAEQ